VTAAVAINIDEQIKVAEYLTHLPSKKVFAEKLQKAIALAQVTLKE
jgi:hypothetical protein